MPTFIGVITQTDKLTLSEVPSSQLMSVDYVDEAMKDPLVKAVTDPFTSDTRKAAELRLHELMGVTLFMDAPIPDFVMPSVAEKSPFSKLYDKAKEEIIKGTYEGFAEKYLTIKPTTDSEGWEGDYLIWDEASDVPLGAWRLPLTTTPLRNGDTLTVSFPAKISLS